MAGSRGPADYTAVSTADLSPESTPPGEWTVVDIPLEKDVYGFLILCLVELWSRTQMTGNLAMEFLHGLLLYTTNVFVQFGTVVFLLNVAFRLEHKLYRSHFRHVRGMTLPEATDALQSAVAAGEPALPTALAGTNDEGQLLLCEAELEVPLVGIYWVMLFWWAVFMVREFKRIRTNLHGLVHVETRTSPEEPLMVDDGRAVVRLDVWMRRLLTVLSPMMKSVIALLLTFVGTKFLVLQTNPFSLVLKVLAMQLVVNFDELMISSMTARENLEKMAKARIQYKIKTIALERRDSWHWSHGVAGLVYFGLACSTVVVTTELMFRFIFEFRCACHLYDQTFNPNYHAPLAHYFGLEEM